MLMMIGPVVFEVQPFNLQGYDHHHETNFAQKPVIGTAPVMEWTGEGAETWSLHGRLFPRHFGGMGTLSLLYIARASGAPQYMIRGDGVLMGWVQILKVNERSSYIDPGGVGKIIDFDVSLQRCDGPSNGAFYAAMAGIFA